MGKVKKSIVTSSQYLSDQRCESPEQVIGWVGSIQKTNFGSDEEEVKKIPKIITLIIVTM